MKNRIVTNLNDHLFTVGDVLTAHECEELIAQSESMGYQHAPINGRTTTQINKDVRSNSRVILDDPDLAESLWQRVKEYLPGKYSFWEPVGLNERFRFYRYEPEERFVWHMDGSFRRDNGDASRVTLLLYLNEVEQGGATSFKEHRVQPETGTALFFLHDYLHQGDPVIKGRKYVLRTDVMYR